MAAGLAVTEILSNLSLGFSVALRPENLIYALIGVTLGTLVGILPGLGPLATIALLLPTTYHVPATGAIIMFAGIYYGAMYGGSTTSILLNIPGESASVVTCLDGYQMARQGRAGAALGIAAFASFLAGTGSVFGLALLAPPLARFALRFGYPEYVTLMCIGIVLVTYLASGSLLKAFMMVCLGFILSAVGQDIISGAFRFDFGLLELTDGIPLAPFIMGLFGISQVIANLAAEAEPAPVATKVRELLPTKEEWGLSALPILRGSLLGFFLGILPGGGAIVSSFAAYAVEKRLARWPERFGRGAIEGVAAPEAANNSATGGAFIPLLSFGIPANVTMAVIMGAFMIHGITPGPLVIKDRPDMFWGVVASMYLGNLALLVLNLPLIGVWVQILRVPYRWLFPLILLVCIVGSYSVKHSLFDVGLMLVAGVVGYAMKKYGYEPAVLVMAFVIGPIMEQSLRQSLLLGEGSFRIFVTRPISAIALGVCAALLLSAVIPAVNQRRRAVAGSGTPA
jgi:putative tricarboxylic transport membrane protein